MDPIADALPEPEPEPAKPRRGFASMDAGRLRAVSSKGGSAARGGRKRGFALMDEARRLEVSRKGLEARRGRPEGDEPPADPVTAPPRTTRT